MITTDSLRFVNRELSVGLKRERMDGFDRMCALVFHGWKEGNFSFCEKKLGVGVTNGEGVRI